MQDDRADFEKLSVKELRRHAALRDVPLTQISAAIEKKDLIGLIMRAGPVTNHYGIGANVKVHSAESIANDERLGKKRPKEKKVKKKKRKSSSSSRRSSSSGKKRKRSKSRKPLSATDFVAKRARERARRKKSRSPSLELVMPTLIDIEEKEKPVLEIADTSAVAVPSAVNAPVAKAVAAEKQRTAPKPAEPSLSARGMAAAAALGYNVLPKKNATAFKEAPGPEGGQPLRPSINAINPGVSLGAALAPGARICTTYLCYARCDLGANCPEAHIIDPEEEMRVRARFKLQECAFGANCKRKECLFRHPGEKMEEHVFTPVGQGITLRNTGQTLALEFS